MSSPISKPTTQAPFTPTTESARGRVLWHELHTKDVATAIAFYTAVAPWTTRTATIGDGNPPYTMLVNGETPIAGVWAYPPGEIAKGASLNWVPYFGTDDTNASYDAAMKAGSKEMLPPTDFPTVGRVAVLRDPMNIMIGLMQPSDRVMPEEAPRDGEFSWHEVAADDPKAALDFYIDLLGWKPLEAMDMGEHGFYYLFGRDRFTYGGMFRRQPGQPGPSWTSYIQVPDLEKSMDAVRTHGGSIVMGPHEVPGGDRISICVDDQGVVFALHGKKKG